jgi:3',5'-cyclic AMP phosphodiesterase CpdA
VFCRGIIRAFMLKFIHLTDLHLTGSGEDHQGYDTLLATRRALEHATTTFPDADFIVITGDLANWGEPGAYLRLEALLATLRMPVFLMIGNHDNRENFLSVFGDRHPFEAPYAQYEADAGAFRLLFLDSQTPGTHGGAFCGRRMAWIAERLEAADRDVLMFMHHHPTPVGAPSLDAKGLANWPEFHALLSRYRHKIRHIFHGHCHAALQGHVEGISFTGLRSMGPQAYTDLKVEQACRWQGAAHYAVVLAGTNSLVTHLQEFGYSGPIHRRDRQNFEEFIAMCAARGVRVPRHDPELEAAQ